MAFSYLQSPEQILTKIKSFSHGEFNENLNENDIQKNIKKRDIFGRNKIRKISIDNSFPEYIRKNKDKLSKWTI